MKLIRVAIIICFSLLLFGCGTDVSSLASFGEQQFLENDADALIQELKEETGLSDLQVTFNIDYNLESYKEDKSIDAYCKLSFKSDEIDMYYTQEDNSENALELLRVFRGIRNVYDKRLVYVYENEDGRVDFRISDGNAYMNYITTSTERMYGYSHSSGYECVDVDTEWVYYEEDDFISDTDMEEVPEMPYVGMRERFLQHTSLGKADIVEECKDFNHLQARAQSKTYEWGSPLDDDWYQVTVRYRMHRSHNVDDYVDLPSHNGYVSEITYKRNGHMVTERYSDYLPD